MDKRRSNRIITRLKAVLIAYGIHYEGIIENISEEGLYMRTLPTDTPGCFVTGTPVELKFQRSEGEPLDLHLSCKIIWSYKTPPYGLTDSIGLEIVDPSVI